jgi:hypothetical protein
MEGDKLKEFQKDIATVLSDNLKKILKKNGSLQVCLYYCDNDDKKIVGFPVEPNDSDKEDNYKDSVKILGCLLAMKSPIVCLSSETWFTTRKPGKDIDVKPSEDPGRSEAILVSVESKEGAFTALTTFHRNRHQKINRFEETEFYWNEPEKLNGRMNGFFNTTITRNDDENDNASDNASNNEKENASNNEKENASNNEKENASDNKNENVNKK